MSAGPSARPVASRSVGDAAQPPPGAAAAAAVAPAAPSVTVSETAGPAKSAIRDQFQQSSSAGAAHASRAAHADTASAATQASSSKAPPLTVATGPEALAASTGPASPASLPPTVHTTLSSEPSPSARSGVSAFSMPASPIAVRRFKHAAKSVCEDMRPLAPRALAAALRHQAHARASSGDGASNDSAQSSARKRSGSGSSGAGSGAHTKSDNGGTASHDSSDSAGRVLLIDVRPYTMYAFTRVRSAVSICIPSTLLKRQTFGFTRIMDFVAPQDVPTLHAAGECSHVVFYDQATSAAPPDSTLRRTAAKFLDADPSLASRLYWLEGGLTALARDVPELVEEGDPYATYHNNSGGSGGGPTTTCSSSSGLAGSGGARGAGSHASLENNASAVDGGGGGGGEAGGRAGGSDVHPKLTLSSLRAAPRSPFSLVPVVTAVPALSSPIDTPSRSHPPLDESSSLRPDTAITRRLSEFPQWLVNAVELTEAGRNVLAEAFQRLQAAEMQRVVAGSVQPRSAQLISPRMRLITPRSTPSTPCTSSGLTSPGTSPLGASKTANIPVSVIAAHGTRHAAHAATTPTSASIPQCEIPNKSAGGGAMRVVVSGEDVAPALPRRDASPVPSLPAVPTRSDEPFVIVAGDDPRKNRYTNIAPFGYNRVLVRGTEYLNASYIRSRDSSFQYIATQAPVPAAFGDFWWCVWEQRVPLIVMLTQLRTESGQVKGNKYWFDSEYDGLRVSLLEERTEPFGANVESGLIFRRIRLSLSGLARDVVQLQYENWPDLGCPADPDDVLQLVEIKKRIMEDSEDSANVIVHCSAGCGRTGTFCAIDTVTDYLSRLTWDEARNDPKDRVLSVVSEFREQRMAMVQNQRQLLLCYQAVMLWYLKQLEAAYPL